MKKILYGTTALVGATVLATSAMAQGLEARVGADIRADFGYVDDDLFGGNDRTSRVDTRIPISIDARADNGLSYGGYLRLRNGGGAPDATGQNIRLDRNFLYISGVFGRMEFGSEWGPQTKLLVGGPFVGIGQLDGAVGAFTHAGYFNGSYTFGRLYETDTKIAYYTPRFAGFQLGASYATQAGNTGNEARDIRRIDDNFDYKDAYQVAANYEQTFGAVSARLGAGYQGGRRTDAAEGLGNLNQWNVNAAVGFAGFTLGGGYFDNRRSFRPSDFGRQDGWHVAATYGLGPWSVGATYGRATTRNPDAFGGRLRDTLWGFGANYVIAPGLSLAADLMFFDIDSASAAYRGGGVDPVTGAVSLPGDANDGTVFIVRTRLSF